MKPTDAYAQIAHRNTERVPVDEVLGAVGKVPFALLGVGPSVNLSPRFNWHTEVRDGRLVLFHGDGLPLKTYLNLKSNPRVVRVLLDPVSFGGWLLEGPVEEYEARQEPVAHQATTPATRGIRYCSGAVRPTPRTGAASCIATSSPATC